LVWSKTTKVRKERAWKYRIGVIFSTLICIESFRLGIGSFHAPGTGFFPFWVGMVFGALSLLLLILTFAREGKRAKNSEKVRWGSIILVLASLFIYAAVLEKIGFVLSTLLFIGALLMIIERKKWHIVAIIAILSTSAFYIVFQIWLQSNLPKGILGF
jgi:putative tricarboxylic transport membrane protein